MPTGRTRAPGFKQGIPKMRPRTACAILIGLAAISFARPQALSATEQAGGHHGRARGATDWNAATGRGAFASPYDYGRSYNYGYPLRSTGVPYDNPYISRSSGCCHGRN